MQPERQSAPADDQGASNVTDCGDHILPGLDHFTRRLLQDALNDARKTWWLKRATDFENARPVPGEFHGNATQEELRARWVWLTEVAAACRARAFVSPLEDIEPEVENVLREVS